MTRKTYQPKRPMKPGAWKFVGTELGVVIAKKAVGGFVWFRALGPTGRMVGWKQQKAA